MTVVFVNGSRKMAFDVHIEIPLEIKFFIIYLALVTKSRNEESTLSGGGV